MIHRRCEAEAARLRNRIARLELDLTNARVEAQNLRQRDLANLRREKNDMERELRHQIELLRRALDERTVDPQ